MVVLQQRHEQGVRLGALGLAERLQLGVAGQTGHLARCGRHAHPFHRHLGAVLAGVAPLIELALHLAHLPGLLLEHLAGKRLGRRGGPVLQLPHRQGQCLLVVVEHVLQEADICGRLAWGSFLALHDEVGDGRSEERERTDEAGEGQPGAGHVAVDIHVALVHARRVDQ